MLGPVNLYPDNKGIYSVIATDWNSSVSSIGAIVIKDNKVLKNNFDVQSYMGKWYQIASIPQFFDQDCIGSAAEYTYLSDKANVYNICYDANWNTIRSITGYATASNPCVASSLIVTFPETPVQLTPNSAQLSSAIAVHVLELQVEDRNDLLPNYLVQATDYRNYSIVGSPTLTIFFILSRYPTMCMKEYKNILKYAQRLGYDVTRVKYSECALNNSYNKSWKHD